jgi:hypothetical protein
MPGQPSFDQPMMVKRKGSSVVQLTAPAGETFPSTTTVRSVSDAANGLTWTCDQSEIIAHGKKLKMSLNGNNAVLDTPPAGPHLAAPGLDVGSHHGDRGLNLAGAGLAAAAPTGMLSIHLDGAGPNIPPTFTSPPFGYMN